MSFVAGVFTFFLIVNCLVLMLLILIQLPKKDAGAGLAFGGGAADALFGAGSGNVLTKITKWAALIFFLLALFLGYFEDRIHNSNSASSFEKSLEQKQSQAPMSFPGAPAAPKPATLPAPQPTTVPPVNPPTPAPVPPATNAPAPPAQSR